ncbi:MAG: 2-C-methyl-D-erythritol 2,4-cyclodiphosphate synthase [Candidatus Coatesbacteria bacterium]|nr:2-C-methyl-D-erythritol 2,4-cyclodiphosphate synthase [Candidatus Coatesbacteria bacterium]
MGRSGIGFDCHRLVEGRKLILGGVEIPYEKGLLGHSDGDSLCHAICDALLGAASLPDIGHQFPDTDPAYKGAFSLDLLAAVREKIIETGFYPVFIDAVIIAQEPKIGPHYEAMREAISGALEIPSSCVSVKASTTEGLGFLGAKEGIAALAIASVTEMSRE